MSIYKLPDHIQDFSFWIDESQLIYSPYALRIRYYDERIEATIEFALQDWAPIQEYVLEKVDFDRNYGRMEREQRSDRQREDAYNYIDCTADAPFVWEMLKAITKGSIG